MPPSRPPSPRIAGYWIALLALAALVYTLSDILAPFVAGLMLAYLGHPLMTRLTQRRVPPSAAALTIVLTLIGLGSGFLLLLVPLLARDLIQLANRLPSSAAAWQDMILPYLPHGLGIDWSNSVGTWRELLQQHVGALEETAQRLLLSARHGGSVLLHLLLTLLLVPVVTFYLLKDGTRLVASFRALIPQRWAPTVSRLGNEIDDVLGQFLRGQVLVMAVMALFYGIGLHFVGISSGLALGVTTGLLVFIPYLGVFIGFILTLLSALIQDPHLLPGMVGVFLVGHVLEGWVVTPRLVGERIGLHPVVVILALLSFGQLLGFLGVVIALPTAAVARILLTLLVAYYREGSPSA